MPAWLPTCLWFQLPGTLSGLDRCELLLSQLQHQAALAAAGQMVLQSQDAAGLACFAAIDDSSWGSLSMLDKQVWLEGGGLYRMMPSLYCTAGHPIGRRHCGRSSCYTTCVTGPVHQAQQYVQLKWCQHQANTILW